jgi:hypothetical protein
LLVVEVVEVVRLHTLSRLEEEEVLVVLENLNQV